MKERTLGFEELELDRNEIYLMMGSPAYRPDPEMKERIEETIRTVTSFCRPRIGYRLLPAGNRTVRSIRTGEAEFFTGSVITRYLKEADQLAVFVATAGSEFEAWMQKETRSGDILREFVAGNIGSEIAEAAGRILAAELSNDIIPQGYVSGNSYSPGYCGWPVSDQHTLFSLLPDSPCGITLHPSGLMTPIKSISGIIPVGEKVRKMPYGCAICEKKDCYKNRTSKTQKP